MLLLLLLPLRLALRHCYIIVSLSSCVRAICFLGIFLMFPRHISFHILYFRISFVSGYPSAPAYSCNPLNQGLSHITTHTPPLIASAPLLLVIAFVTSTPESDCQCSFCYYRLPQLPRVNANVSNNRMHVTYHEPGRFR